MYLQLGNKLHPGLHNPVAPDVRSWSDCCILGACLMSFCIISVSPVGSLKKRAILLMLIYWIYREVQEWTFSASSQRKQSICLHIKWLIAQSTRILGCCYLSWEDILCIIMFCRNIMIFLLVTSHLVESMLQCVILPTWTSFSDSKHVSLVLFRLFCSRYIKMSPH